MTGPAVTDDGRAGGTPPTLGIVGAEHSLAARTGPLAAVLPDVGVADLAGACAALAAALTPPRLVLLDLPPGAGIDAVIEAIYPAFEPSDALVDLSGSYWGDTLRRWRRMRHRSVFYLDAAFMGPGLLLGGDERGVAFAAARLERPLAPTTLLPSGPPGSAHYSLMVHEALAVAAAEIVAEGRQALEAFPDAIADEAQGLALQPAAAPAWGRAAWLADDALRLQAALPLLSQGVILGLSGALDRLELPRPMPRLGLFVHPDELG